MQRNIETKGRVLRAVAAIVSGVAGVLLLPWNIWVAIALFASAGFLAFEALRGWCGLRVSGVRTKF